MESNINVFISFKKVFSVFSILVEHTKNTKRKYYSIFDIKINPKHKHYWLLVFDSFYKNSFYKKHKDSRSDQKFKNIIKK